VPDTRATPLAQPVLEPDEVLVESEAIRQRGPEAELGASAFVLEIGFGRAELIMELARARPAQCFLGVEVSRKRVQKAARRIARAGIPNLRVVHATAEYLLERVLRADSVSECWINFPDPWPKKRHHRRRLLRREVLPLLARVLRPGAILHLATDYLPYADSIDGLLAGSELFDNLHAPEPWSRIAPQRCTTAYEQEFLAEGRAIAYFEYKRLEARE